MKKFLTIGLSIVMLFAFSNESFAQKKEKKKKCKKKEACTQVFTNNIDTVSYIIGADIARNFAANYIELNNDMVFKGFLDAQKKADTLFNEESIGTIMTAWQTELGEKRQKMAQEKMQENAKLGDEFLTANKAKEGVVELPSGLQYKVLKEGEGESPDINDMVEVHYTGTLIDGTKFDSSRDRNEPVEFPVNGVIPGWTEALQLMKPGSHYMLYIPAKLAYGDKKTGPIPEGSTLIFDVELLKVEKK